MTKYDMRLNPVYQVDFSAHYSGKRVSATKRKVCFRFGFSNAEAIAKNLTGVGCRGEEHEVILTWSLTSGKRVVVADGAEVHYSQGNRSESKFETSWSFGAGHIIKLTAHASPPLFQAPPGWKQYDLELDGFSFFNMPRIFELGKNKDARLAVEALEDKARTKPFENSIAPESLTCFHGSNHCHDREEKHMDSYHSLAMSTIHEGEDAVRQKVQPPRAASEPIMDFLDLNPEPYMLENSQDMVPVRATTLNDSAHYSTMSTGPYIQTAAAAATPFKALANESHTYYTANQGAYYHQQETWAYPATSPQCNNVPVSPSQQAVGAHQTFTSPYQPHMYEQPVISYSTPPSAPAIISPSNSSPMSSVQSMHLSMEPLNVDDISADAHHSEYTSDLDHAVHRLVNFDDITEKLVSPEQFKAQCKKNQSEPKSKPLPPAKTDWHCPTHASLNDIHSHKQSRAESKKPIMRTYEYDPTAVQAGALVVYGGGHNTQHEGMLDHQRHHPGYYHHPSQPILSYQQPILS